jgi:uncharacterized protein YaiI (UPF0178 family)
MGASINARARESIGFFIGAHSVRLASAASIDQPGRLGATVSAALRRSDARAIIAAMMKIWVDADACPVVIKEILFRAAERVQVPVTLVANQPIRVPPSRFVCSVQVGAGFDVADNAIVARLDPGDLVITADIPLAAEVIEKGGHALNPRGELYSAETIRSRLDVRDFMEALRASGVDTGGPAALHPRDRQAFANQLDRFLHRYARERDRNKIEGSDP